MNFHKTMSQLDELVINNHPNKLKEFLAIFSEVKSRRAVLGQGEKRAIRRFLLKELPKLDATFNQWAYAHSRIGYFQNEHDLRNLCAKKMAQTAKTFEDWHAIYSRRVSCLEYADEAVAKMKELAETDEQYLALLKMFPDDKSLQRIASGEICERIESLDEWLLAYRRLPTNSSSKPRFLELLMGMKVDFESIYGAYRISRRGSDARACMIQKIISMDIALEDLCRVYIEVAENDEMKKIVFNKMRYYFDQLKPE